MSSDLTKDQVAEAIKGLPDTFVVSTKHMREGFTRISHAGGCLFVRAESQNIRLTCVCLERSVSMLVPPLEARERIEGVARSHKCVPWPG